MGTRAPSLRVLQSGLSPRSNHVTPCYHVSLQSRRTLFNFFKKNKKSDSSTGPENPVLAEFLKRKPSKDVPTIERGDLAPSSIFDAEKGASTKTTKAGKPIAEEATEITVGGEKRSIANMSSVLDPRPRARERWQRKMVIREVRRGGRLKPAEFIRRTERESTAKSHNIKTSIKKLGPLARQIQGKTLDDAIAQMRFSKKKAAKDVLEHLQEARDEAIVRRGMGLGDPDAVVKPEPAQIQLKDGKRHTVTDPNAMYIDQAFVGRGPFGKLYDYRARGNVNIMRTPWTHLTVTLKEEATRLREAREREEKRRRQRLDKVWTHLPDRPIQGQRPYYTW